MSVQRLISAFALGTAVLIATVPAPAQAVEVSTRVDIRKTSTFKGDFNQLKSDFEKKEAFLKLFPNVDAFKATGDDTWSTRMKPMGMAGVYHVTEYTANYQFQPADNQLVLVWKTLPGQGNAQLSGKTVFTRNANDEVSMNMVVQGELSKIDVPAIYAMGAGSVTRGFFEKNIDQFMAVVEQNYRVR